MAKRRRPQPDHSRDVIVQEIRTAAQEEWGVSIELRHYSGVPRFDLDCRRPID
jgi:hypothetical protein